MFFTKTNEKTLCFRVPQSSSLAQSREELWGRDWEIRVSGNAQNVCAITIVGTVLKLDKMGACVLATCLTKEGEHSLKSEASDELKTFQLDVTNSEQLKDVYEEIKKAVSPGKIRIPSGIALRKRHINIPIIAIAGRPTNGAIAETIVNVCGDGGGLDHPDRLCFI